MYFTYLLGYPIGAIALNVGMLNDVVDVITSAKFCDSQFRGFVVLNFLHPRFCLSS